MDGVMPGFGSLLRVFWILFVVAFVGAVAVLVFILLRSKKDKKTNDNAPRLKVDAKVVSKRTNVAQRHVPVGGDATGAHGYYADPMTSYYATFEVESGDRLELAMTGREYGMLVEGDYGSLSFQGTRFLNFERKIYHDPEL